MADRDDPTQRWDSQHDDATEVFPTQRQPSADEGYRGDDSETRAFAQYRPAQDQYQPTQQPEWNPQYDDSVPDQGRGRETPYSPPIDPEQEALRQQELEERRAADVDRQKVITKIVIGVCVTIIVVASLIAWAMSRDKDPAPTPAPAAPEQQQAPLNPAPPPIVNPVPPPVAENQQGSDQNSVLEGLQQQIDGLQQENDQLQQNQQGQEGQEVTTGAMPDVVDQSAGDAEDILKEAGFTKVKFLNEDGGSEFAIMVSPNTVLRTEPASGTETDLKSTINVVVESR